MSGFKRNMPLIGAGAVRRAAISAGALLALVAVLLSGSGYNHTAAQGIPGGVDPGFQDPAAPGGINPGPSPETAPAPGGGAPGTSLEPEQSVTQEESEESETADAGYLGLGLLPGVNYAPDRLIIRYKDMPLGVVNELSTATVSPLLTAVEAQRIAVEVSEDIAELDRGFDIANLEVDGGIPERNTYFVVSEGEFDPLELSFALNELENVEYAQPDYYVVPAGGHGSSAAGGEWYKYDINLAAAQEYVRRNHGGHEPKVAVLDLSFQEGRERPSELEGRWTTSVKVPYESLSTEEQQRLGPADAHGYVEVPGIRGWDTDDDDADLQLDEGALLARDDYALNHGDYVATVLASDRHGVYRDGKILPIKIASDIPINIPGGFVGSHTSAVVAGIELAERNGAEIINASFFTLNNHFTIGGVWAGALPGECRDYLTNRWSVFWWLGTVRGEALYDAIAEFDGLYVTGAMNQKRKLGFNYYDPKQVVSYPQLFAEPIDGVPHEQSFFSSFVNCYNSELTGLTNLINVGGTERDDGSSTKLWENGTTDHPGSNHSPRYVHIAAPARGVRVAEGVSLLGTSFATPQVAGTAAMMLTVGPNLPPDRLIKIINYTGRHQESLDGYVWNGKTLDANAAVRCADRLDPGRYSPRPHETVFDSRMQYWC